jgi:cytochrome bd-type quinol oxidase subunit 1
MTEWPICGQVMLVCTLLALSLAVLSMVVTGRHVSIIIRGALVALVIAVLLAPVVVIVRGWLA